MSLAAAQLAVTPVSAVPTDVSKSCAGPEPGGAVRPGESVTCTVTTNVPMGTSARQVDDFQVIPTSPSTATVTSCGGAQGVPISVISSTSFCEYHATGGVASGSVIGTEVLTIPSGTPGGTALQQDYGEHVVPDPCGHPGEPICLPQTGGTAPMDVTGAGSVVAADAPLTASGRNVSGTESQSLTAAVATFTDADPSPRLADFSATITWGDGSSSAGAISAASGGFQVTGSHTYAEDRSYPISVAIRDAGGATASASSSARIADSTNIVTRALDIALDLIGL